jgi:TonB family protein
VAAVSATFFSNSDGRIPAYLVVVALHVAAIFGSFNANTIRALSAERRTSPITVFILPDESSISTPVKPTNWLAGAPRLTPRVREALPSLPLVDIPPSSETASPEPVVARLPGLVNQAIEPPVLDQARSPATAEFYPESSRKKHEFGTTTLEATIFGGGAVIGEVQIQHSSGFAGLDQAAVRWLRHTIWTPPTQNGFAVSSRVSHSVQFDQGV